jgi:hypothetical protein
VNVSLLAPAGSVYVAFDADFVDVVSDQVPTCADWEWAMDILDAHGIKDAIPVLLFEQDIDIWRFPRI